MATHWVKCLYCGEIFDAASEPYVKPKPRRYAHLSCANKLEENKSKEEQNKQQLEDYIKQIFNIDKLTPKIENQIKTFHADKNLTYFGMYQSLKYWYEVKNNSIEKANGGIGIIPYVYDDAFIYWKKIWDVQKQNQEVNIQDYISPAKEIHIHPPDRNPMKHIRKLFTFLESEEEVNEE